SSFAGSTAQFTTLAARLLSSRGGHAAAISSAQTRGSHHWALFGCHIDHLGSPVDGQAMRVQFRARLRRGAVQGISKSASVRTFLAIVFLVAQAVQSP